MEFPTADIAERVNRGAEWLDALYPEWWTTIDLASLRLEDACRCVLGQVFTTVEEPAGYYNVLNRFFRNSFEDPSLEKDFAAWATSHGFVTGVPRYGSETDRMLEYRALDEAWILAIKERADRGLSADDHIVTP